MKTFEAGSIKEMMLKVILRIEWTAGVPVGISLLVMAVKK
jgi:hypothetical protein